MDHGEKYDTGSYRSRQSTELLNQAGRKSAGYNRMEYVDPGRTEPLKGGYDEEEHLEGPNSAGWDVFADFNNAGPRYSAAPFQSNTDSGSYNAVSHSPNRYDDAASSIGPVEMVTVPALGPEWNAEELRDMTRSGRRERNNEERMRAWTQFRRGERGLCGKWFTWKHMVFVAFGLCVAIGIILAFVIPRVPGFALNLIAPLGPANGTFNASIPTEFSRAPANFSFPAFANLQVNTASNYLPLKFKHIAAQVLDLDSGVNIANGDLYSLTVPAKQYTNIVVPLNFSYVATNDTDKTWANWHAACQNTALATNGTRPGIRFSIVLDFTIVGLVGHSETATQVNNAECPIELPMNAA